MGRVFNRGLVLLLVAMLVAMPALANPNGPPWENGGGLTVESGCTCHGDGDPSTAVVVSISGVPRSYAVGAEYSFTISLGHAEYGEGGYMLWDYGAGTLTAGEGSIQVAEEPGAVSQGAVGNDWTITWTAPAEDIGPVRFQLVGNAVDGNGAPNANDAWNVLSFMISEPGSTVDDDVNDRDLRTISVGDYESLFVAEEDPEAIEAAEQAKLAESFFENGNVYYWATLSIFIVGAVVQGELSERRFGGGPKHLDRRLAVPQGIRRGLLAAGLGLGFAWAVDSNQPWGYALLLGMLTLWAAYGVYRTIVQARADPVTKDLV
ncbi:MAG: choice-of-anchor V domain-containing protein [Candidatus Thermoplasmatota archaeon]|nr:choice-of-anchor V domain-containing protein [Candidatus Thermoplasmatota archaeon]